MATAELGANSERYVDWQDNKTTDEAPEQPAPRRKRSDQFDSLDEKAEAETRLVNEP